MKKANPTITYSALGVLSGVLIVSPALVIFFHALRRMESVNQFVMPAALRALTVDMLCWGFAIILISAFIGYRVGKIAQAAAHLREANAAKNVFFAVLGHDLRSPLSVLSGFLELLDIGYDRYDERSRKQYIRNSLAAARRLGDLLEDLLAWSRIQRGKMPYQPEQSDVFLLADETVMLLEGNAQKKGIALRMQIQENTQVYGDPQMIKAIIRNLVSNAVKFTPSGGAITISSASVGHQEEITVADTGVGMSHEEVQKLFRIESASSKPGTDKEPGTGFGLLLCKEFVEKNGGTIAVESEVGAGSRFRVTLPKQSDSRQRARAEKQGAIRQAALLPAEHCPAEYQL